MSLLSLRSLSSLSPFKEVCVNLNLNLESYLAARSDLIEKQLNKLVPESPLPYNILFQAARYSLLNGGKRLRPILALATAETLGADIKTALSPACALEMVHTYSLIHDDLPCMDDDDFRRGKLSLHKAFPEGHAVLAGDYLLTHAFHILAEDTTLSNDKKVRLISILSKRSGGDGMIGGQVMDLESEGKQISLETLRLIHRNKTGAMITASIEFGGIIAEATESQQKILHKFGEEIGLAFQIIDDVLDVASKQEVAKQKATYVSLLGVEKSKALAYDLLHSALAELSKLPKDVGLLSALAERLVTRST